MGDGIVAGKFGEGFGQASGTHFQASERDVLRQQRSPSMRASATSGHACNSSSDNRVTHQTRLMAMRARSASTLPSLMTRPRAITQTRVANASASSR